MGRVFLGLSPGGRSVAVKVVRAELAADPEFRTRFRQEVAAARGVSGVFTAPVLDADIDGPVAWLATAYVPGPSLAEAVDRHGPLPEGSVLALAAGLAESLTAIHAAGVVHQDLTPSNVLLAQDGPRVIDFGISQAAESSPLARAGPVIGSPGFMSPDRPWAARSGRRATSSASGRCSPSPPLARDRSGRGQRQRCFIALFMRSPALIRCRPQCGPFSVLPRQGPGPASHRQRPASRGGPSPADRELAA